MILDFLKLATEKAELTKELIKLAGKHDFEFSDEVSDEKLQDIAGGTLYAEKTAGTTDSINDQWQQAADESREFFKKVMSSKAQTEDSRLQEDRTSG